MADIYAMYNNKADHLAKTACVADNLGHHHLHPFQDKFLITHNNTITTDIKSKIEYILQDIEFDRFKVIAPSKANR